VRDFIFCLICLGMLFFAGCGSKEIKIPEFDEQNAMSLLVKLVSFGPRSAGTAANLRQAEFIAKTARSYGAKTTSIKFKHNTSEGLLQFVNIEVVIPGKRKDFVIIGSHFDTKKMPAGIKFEGANDGASSTAVLLELIKTIKASGTQPEYTLKFVFFDGEECFNEYGANDGLFGSKHYARQLNSQNLVSECRAVIILDMIGDKDLNVTLPLDSDKQLCEMLFKAADKSGNRKYFDYLPTILLDDHTPFKEMGIPVIDIIDFEFGPKNSFWHSSEDNITNISAKSLKIIGQTTLNLLFSINFAKKT
jgi:Zn-dependent M28 family amino/carboxypeptidase